jgi:hypothetical protein
VARLAGYDQRLQMLERGHVHRTSAPLGGIMMFAGDEAPEGWAVYDGPGLTAPPGILFIIKVRERSAMPETTRDSRGRERFQPQVIDGEPTDAHRAIPLDNDEDGRWLDRDDPRRLAAEERLGRKFDDDEASRREQRRAERQARRGD